MTIRTTLPSPPVDKKRLRRNMRQKRRSLSAYQQQQAAQGLAAIVRQSELFKRCKHIAIYLANDGEIDPFLLVQQLWKSKKRVYMPVLHPIKKNRLWFYRYQSKTRLTQNRFGIYEPALKNRGRIPPWALNLVLLPLVAFDREGGRLGMGGGFYDRTFEFTLKSRADGSASKTRLYGLAHHFQQVEQLPVDPWDIPLQGVATEKALYRMPPPHKSRRTP